MVKAEPCFLRFTRQRREPFVNGRPVAEHFEPLGFAGCQRFFQIKHALIADFLHEIHIDLRDFVFQQKPARFAEQKAVVAGVDGADGERGFKQHLRGVCADACLPGDFVLREPAGRLVQQLKNAVFQHQPRYLEHNRRKGDFLREPLRFACGLVFLRIALF